MQKGILLLCLLLPVSQAFTQWSIGYSKRSVRQTLRAHCRSNNWSINNIVEEPYSTALHINDSSYYRTSFYHDFDKRGKCFRERKVTTCDTCYRKYRNGYLDRAKYEWVPLNDTTYVSKYTKKRRLDLSPANHTIEFTKERWTKEEYENLMTSGLSSKDEL